MLVAVPREIAHEERRVALVPELIPKLKAAGIDVAVEAGAGDAAGFPDAQYLAKGARLEGDAKAMLSSADVVLKVRPPLPVEIDALRESATFIGFLFALTSLDLVRRLTARKVTAFAMDLMPRISRAQSMDALSSQSNIAGYKAVLIAAESAPKMFPLMMTAAGTISPAKVFVMGAGVAGLQAIATARRLGALVDAYDVRPVAKEQVESLGAKFVRIQLDAKEAQDASGYAKAQSEEFLQKQRELLATTVAAYDVVITTALVPGLRAPILVPEEAVRQMRPGSVIVDLAAEQGGNCALTEPGKTVVKHGVTIHGPLSLPSTVAYHASQMYARNVTSFLLHLVKDGKLSLDLKDELTRGPLVTIGGEVVHESVKAALAKTGGGS